MECDVSARWNERHVDFYVKRYEISKCASAIKRSRFPNAYTKGYAFEYEDNLNKSFVLVGTREARKSRAFDVRSNAIRLSS